MRLLTTWTMILFAFGILFPGLALAEKGERNFARSASPAREDNVQAVQSSNPARTWLALYKGESTANYKTIMAFIEKYPDFPAMNKLRTAAEKAMPTDISDKTALLWFTKNPPQTTFGMRTYSGALIRAGQKAAAVDAINQWWRTANLTPADQSKAYMAFATSLDRNAHEERLRVLIHKGQYTNARLVAEALGNGHLALTEARIALRSGNGNASALIGRVPSSLMNDEGLLFDRLQWRRKDGQNAGAIEILNKTPGQDAMYSGDDWGKERGIIVRRLMEEKKYGLAYLVSSKHRLKSGAGFATNEWVAGWLAVEYLNKPWDAFEHFERLYHNVETPISKSRAAYWAGYASEKLGHPDVAKKWYQAGAKLSTTFYGQLAAEKLGGSGVVSRASVQESKSFENGSLGTATRWLKQNGHKAEAAMFLNKMIDVAKTPQEFAAVAELAGSLWMKNIGIKAAQECEKKTGVTLIGYAFPRVEKYMTDLDVEWALVHALIRQESRYDAEALSSAGARGLMQLMPATANEVARKAGMSHQTAWLTSKPGHNIALGTRYLQQLLRKYDGNYAMALAAYNAGPSRVDRWVGEIGDPRRPDTDLVNWIEMIPIYETRNYVQRVLEGVYVYRKTLARNAGMNGTGTTHLASQ